jgi:hypothetical protein
MTGFGISFRSKAPIGVVGKLFASIFFLVFLAMGALFVWLTAREAAEALRTWTWHRTPCEILSSDVRETDQQERRTGKFYFDVTYRYTLGGQTFTSDRYKRSSQSFSDYGKVARLTERYRAESAAVCYVNPSAPAEAVLERDNLFIVPLVLFPMVFVAIGAGGIYFTWRRKPAADKSAQAISDRAGPTKSRWVLRVFFLFFLLMGSGAFYAFFLRPAFKILGARTWPAVPCVVLSSEVKSHSDSDGVTYSVNILYSYEFKGREFKANRYHFMGGSSSGYSGKKAIVARHAPGTKTICYVNPNEPTEAVLERGFTPDLWFGLIPLAFIAVGAGGLAFALRRRSPSALAGGVVAGRVSAASGSALGAVPALQHTGAFDSGLLKPKASPWAKLFGIIAIALFWNGIVSVFVKEAVDSWRSGRPEWLLTLFLVPFVLIGLGFLGGIFYCFLALFNPRPRLRATPGAVPLGGTLSVEWQVTGRTEVLRRLRVRLQGREEAKYRRGTSTCTDTSLFADLELADITTHQEMRSGYRTVTVPAHLMHSFASDNNRVVWSISLHGEIPRWPDVKEEFPVTVLPIGEAEQERL